MSRLQAFAGVARGPFLLLPVTLVASGAAAAAWDGAFSWSRTLLALVGLLALHAAVNIFNEVSDMRTGIDLNTRRTPFSGGSGTLPSGALSLRAAFVFGVLCAAAGLAIGLWFLREVGTVILPIVVVGGFLVVGYTNFLARIGLGEIAAGLGLGALPILGTALVQDGRLGAAAMAIATPAFFMTFNLLLLNEFPDEEADRKGGRRNLVLIFGRTGAARIYAVAGLLTPVSIVAAVVSSALPWTALAAALPSLLLVKPLSWAFGDPSAPVPLPALGANVGWNLATNSVLAAGIALALALR
jgi:1,4-dihydroxy-2-naphthoate octaprenyltransferase